MAAYQDYVGRQERRTDVITEVPLQGFAALLDKPLAEVAPGGWLPPLGHWLYFLNWVPQSQIGPDGHPKRGSFLPPVELPRRMYAGSRLEFPGDLHVGDRIERVATITSVQEKEGASGRLVFVTVRHDISGPRGLAIRDEQDIVYRGAAPANARAAAPASEPRPPVPPPAGAKVRELRADPVLLFRYSALIGVSHRIHYDRSYTMEEEGYPGLVVHGPLQATLLADHLRTHWPKARLERFTFRAKRPVFDIAPFRLVAAEQGGGRVALSTQDLQGQVCMEAEAVIS